MSLILPWAHAAGCHPRLLPPGVDKDDFFPVGTTGPAVAAQVARAKAVCGGCQVQAVCLEYALTNTRDAGHGVWGGMTPEEREAERRRRRKRRAS